MSRGYRKILRIIILIIIIVVVLVLALGIYGIVSSYFKEPDLNYTEPKIKSSGAKGTTELTGEENEVDRDNLPYYDTIEEATINNNFDSTVGKDEIEQKILTLENDDDAILFFKTYYKKNVKGDAVAVYKYAVKQEGGKRKYSRPIAGEVVKWETFKVSYKKMALSDADKVRLGINVDNAYQNYNLNPEIMQLQWGLLDTKKAQYMTVDGKAPTKVIPLELDGDKVYFWYYEDLKTGPVEDLDIEFNKKASE
ncbi:hypothetical protein [Listeria ilorinensis]|uniref:hypothetical protein n=1 Tax=Listeria ilorinensis TaxID=2867439 RepID=UPI001EF48808|nr:hypothetical protein [Listeria ilorinensis]